MKRAKRDEVASLRKEVAARRDAKILGLSELRLEKGEARGEWREKGKKNG